MDIIDILMPSVIPRCLEVPDGEDTAPALVYVGSGDLVMPCEGEKSSDVPVLRCSDQTGLCFCIFWPADYQSVQGV